MVEAPNQQLAILIAYDETTIRQHSHRPHPSAVIIDFTKYGGIESPRHPGRCELPCVAGEETASEHLCKVLSAKPRSVKAELAFDESRSVHLVGIPKVSGLPSDDGAGTLDNDVAGIGGASV